jgi:hypothetical protein
MKAKIFSLVVLILITLNNFLFSQENLIPTKQLMMGITNVGQHEMVNHNLTAIGKVWEWNDAIWGFRISTNPEVYNSTLTTYGPADFTTSNWPGFNLIWLSMSPPYWGLGLFKVTNSKYPGKYFYLDARDSDYGSIVTPPDFYVYFNGILGKYAYSKEPPPNPGNHWTLINQGELVKVSRIFNRTPKTSGLPNFWSNALVLVNNGQNHPRLIWGVYPNDNFVLLYYKVYKLNYEGVFEVYATTTNTEFVDYNETIVTGPLQANEFIVKYKVTAVGYLNNVLTETEFTNTVEARVQGFAPYKIGAGNSNVPDRYFVFQNYPNPFNPRTRIQFSIPEEVKVTIKVYDVLGNEVMELVNDKREAGNYEVEFDGSGLNSGIYFYTFRAGEYVSTKKMILVK